MCIEDLNDDKIVETFCEKEYQKTTQIEFRVEKVIKRKGRSCMSNYHSFNSWTDKKDIAI